MGIKQILRDFSGWTSAHGIPHIGSSHHWPLTCFWTSIFVLNLAGFLYFFISLLIRYFSYGVNFQTELHFKELTFPALTFCNINPYKSTKIPQRSQIEELVNAYNYVTHGTLPVPNELFDLDNYQNDIERQYRAKELLVVLVKKYMAQDTSLDSFYANQGTTVAGPVGPGAPAPAPVTVPAPGPNIPAATTAEDEEITTTILAVEAPTTTTTSAETTITTTTNNMTIITYTYSSFIQSAIMSTLMSPTTSTSTTSTSTTSTSTTSTSTTSTTPTTSTSTSTGAQMPTTTRGPISQLVEAIYGIDDMVINCAFNGDQCEPDDLTVIFDPTHGNCFQFNNNPLKEYYKTSRSGPIFGLKLLLRVDQSLYLPFISEAGIKLVVHEQGGDHFINSYGYTASPGYTTTFGVKYVETVRLPLPYEECTAEKDDNYIYEGDYGLEGCIRTCIQDHIIDVCGCANPLYPQSSLVTEYPWCNETKIDCVETANGTFDLIQNCSCHLPCAEVEHSAKMSQANWPSKGYLPNECIQKGGAGSEKRAECLEWYNKNTVLLQVFFERMNYQTLFESEDYKALSLVSDTGGQLGFFLGTSFITVVEMVALLLLIGLFVCTRGKSLEFNDDDIDKEIAEEFDEDYCRKPVGEAGPGDDANEDKPEDDANEDKPEDDANEDKPKEDEKDKDDKPEENRDKPKEEEKDQSSGTEDESSEGDESTDDDGDDGGDGDD